MNINPDLERIPWRRATFYQDHLLSPSSVSCAVTPYFLWTALGCRVLGYPTVLADKPLAPRDSSVLQQSSGIEWLLVFQGFKDSAFSVQGIRPLFLFFLLLSVWGFCCSKEEISKYIQSTGVFTCLRSFKKSEEGKTSMIKKTNVKHVYNNFLLLVYNDHR